MPIPPAGTASPSRIARASPPASICWMHDRLGGHLDVLQLGEVGVRPAAERQDHLLAGVDVVAVDEHPHGVGARGWRLGARVTRRDATGRAVVAARVGRRRDVPRSSRSSRRSSRLASAIDDRTHCTNSTANRTEPDQVAGSPRGCRRRGAGRRPDRAATASSACSDGVPVAADQVALTHDRDAEERVERQRQDQHQHPERVAHPPGDRVDADDRGEEQRADHHQVDVHQLVQDARVERRVVPAGEVERPRAEHVEREGQRREGEHLGRPASAARPAASRAAAAAACAAPASPAPERAEAPAPPSTGSCAGPCATLSRVCRTPPARSGGEVERAHPADHEGERAAERPAVPALVQPPHAVQVEPGRPHGEDEEDRRESPLVKTAEGEKGGTSTGVERSGEGGSRQVTTRNTGGQGCPCRRVTAIMTSWRQQRLSRHPGSMGITTVPAWSAWARSCGSPAS